MRTDIVIMLTLAAVLGWGFFALAMYQWGETIREWQETLDELRKLEGRPLTGERIT